MMEAPVLTARPLTLGSRTTPSRTMTATSMRSESLQRTNSEELQQALRENPFEIRHGRRYLRSELPYPLPCDLQEIQRQSLRTLLGVQVFGGPVCSPQFQNKPPKKVLELGCGSAYWTALCHDHFVSKGWTNVEFVGIDIAPVAPNLKRQGVNWKFVQHDLRKAPLPFRDEEFDYLMCRDMAMAQPLNKTTEKMLMDCIRILKPGGSLEVCDSDYVIRSMLGDEPPAPPKKPAEQEVAERTGTFALPMGHPFAPSPNRYIQKANEWIRKALDQRALDPEPSVRIAEMLNTEPDLRDLGFRRIAIPLAELRWEKEERTRIINGHDSPMATGSFHSADTKDKSPTRNVHALRPDQLALRQTALMTVLGQIESMEPILNEVSGKNAEEWGIWWGCMMSELLDSSRGGLTSECLEIGTWWATKSGDGDDDEWQ